MRVPGPGVECDGWCELIEGAWLGDRAQRRYLAMGRFRRIIGERAFKKWLDDRQKRRLAEIPQVRRLGGKKGGEKRAANAAENRGSGIGDRVSEGGR